MATARMPFRAVRMSLAEIAGTEYVSAVCEARARFSGESFDRLYRQASRRVTMYPPAFHARLLALLPTVGQPLFAPPPATAQGATSRLFAAATHTAAAPVNGYGFYRAGEGGRLFLMTKSEHYHTPVGHAFPGYQLIDIARRLGIPNATHNNTRGHLTRLLEEALVGAVHGIDAGDSAALSPVLAGEALDCPNRVLNLETGSLATEAALKMMLARFYRVQDNAPEPRYRGRIPVMLVMGNDSGGPHANYHGTTMLTQTLRGMWPELAAAHAEQGLLRICPLRPNVPSDIADAFARYEQPPYKIAGFFHEIVMMNYGARLLDRAFLHDVYARCAAHDVPTAVDEIQSCLWAPGLFLFREFGLRPTFVITGKGFPGGEYPASRVIFSAAMDNLPQFGALVTNGQEELASLAYLITMRWALENTEVTQQIGAYYEERLRDMARQHPGLITGIAGQRHLAGIEFADLTGAQRFVATLSQMGLDVSAQTYKADCPPIVLTKLPLIACRQTVDFIVARMTQVLQEIAASASAVTA